MKRRLGLDFHLKLPTNHQKTAAKPNVVRIKHKLQMYKTENAGIRRKHHLMTETKVRRNYIIYHSLLMMKPSFRIRGKILMPIKMLVLGRLMSLQSHQMTKENHHCSLVIMLLPFMKITEKMCLRQMKIVCLMMQCMFMIISIKY